MSIIILAFVLSYLHTLHAVNSRASPEAACRIRVRGRVQGVYFRASTAERAIALSLCGRAENLRDGSVLVLAAGSQASLAQLIAWLGELLVLRLIRNAGAAAKETGLRSWITWSNQALEHNAYARHALFFFARQYGVAHL